MNQFDTMTETEWVEWLDTTMLGGSADPPLQRANRELHQDLLALFRSLPADAAVRMTEAVGQLLRVTPLVDAFVERLYTLIEVAATTKPKSIYRYVDRVLRTEVGRNLSYAHSDLHCRLLTLIGRYDVDERLVDYVDESAWRIREWRYALRGFGVASVLSAAHGGRLLPLLVDLIAEEPGLVEIRTQQLAVQLAAVVIHHGHAEVAKVFLDFSERHGAAKTVVLAASLAHALNTLPRFKSPRADALQLVLLRSAEVVLGSIPLANMWEVARRHRDVGVALIERTVAHIWRCEEPRFKDDPPWDIVTKLDEFLPADKDLTDDGDWIFRANAEPLRVDSKQDVVAFAVIAAIASAHQKATQVAR